MKPEDIKIKRYTIQTERITLRPFKPEDADDVFAYASRPGTGEAEGRTHLESKEEAEKIVAAFIEEGRTFAVEDKQSGRVIGSAAFETADEYFSGKELGENINQIGYVLGEDYWGKGYAVEIVRAMISFAFFTLHLDAVTAVHLKENEAAATALLRCGFKLLGEGKFTAPDKTECDTCCYALTNTDFGVKYE